MRRARSGLLRAAAVSLVAVAMGPVANALAEPPNLKIDSPTAGSYVNNPTPAFSGTTEDLLDQVTLKIYAGTGVGGSLEQTLTTTFPPSGGTWTLEPTAALSDGVYTAQASQTNLSETSSSEPPVTFTVDTTPPAVSLTAVASPTNDSTPGFSGGAGVAAGDIGSVTLKIYPGNVASGTPASTVSVTQHGGTWNASPGEDLPDGTYTAEVEQSDEAGNTGVSLPSTFTVDTSSPAVSLSPVSSPTNDSTPSFGGGAGVAGGDIAEVKLRIYAGSTASGSPVRTIAVTPLGATWSATPSEGLADGTYTAEAEQSDEAGNTGTSAPSTFTVDTTPPSVHITTPPNGSFVNSSKPTLSGTAGSATGDQTTVTLNVYTGTSVSGSPSQTLAVTRSGGSWTTGSSGPQLIEGTYTVQAEQSDEAGNTGTSSPSTFTIKTKGPAVSLTPVASPTNDPTPSFNGGAGVAQGDIATVTVKVYSGTSASGSPVRTLPVAPSSATWTVTPSEALPEGTYTVQAEQSDEAGDTNPSATSTFIIDTTPPLVHVASPANGSFVSNSKPTLSGTAGSASGDGTKGSASGDGTKVTLSIHDVTSNTTLTPVVVSRSGTSWTTGSSGPQLLDQNTYTVVAEQSDEAGNTGTSTPSTFMIKTQGPAVSLTPVASPTNDSTPTFGGSAGDIAGDIASVRLKIYSGTTASGSPTQTVSVTPSGATWTTGPAGQLKDGTYTAQAEQSDEASNTTKSATTTFTVDTAPPSVLLSLGPSERHTSTPQFEGNAGVAAGDIPSVRLKIYQGPAVSGAPFREGQATLSGGKWKAAPSGALPNGSYTAQAEQSDEAGNIGKSPPSRFTVVTKGPVVTLTPVAAETRDSTPSFAGSAGGAPGDSSVRLKVYSGAVASGSSPVRELAATPAGGIWATAPVETLADGTYTALAEQSDSLANTGVSTESTFTVDTAPPLISLTSPANGSSTSGASESVEGAAGTAAGDSPTVSVKLVAGSTIAGQAPLQTRVVPVASGRWQVNFEGLATGTYTAEAEQTDEAGNTGRTEPVTFTVVPPPSAGASAQPPSTSFTWLPSAPHTGETVSLLSSSTDISSPITAFAWDLLGSGPFNAGQLAIGTSFSTPGNHVVRLRVTAADGLSSVAAETIPVSGPPHPLMQPFPVVRIVSTDTSSGIRLKLLRVLHTPAGAQITVTCRGRGCPVKSLKRVAALVKGSVPAYTFGRVQRSLRAGVMLEVRVFKAGQIGKYTRLTVRRGKLPQRVDLCLDPAGVKPIVCPSS
jgi:hypothetical protein